MATEMGVANGEDLTDKARHTQADVSLSRAIRAGRTLKRSNATMRLGATCPNQCSVGLSKDLLFPSLPTVALSDQQQSSHNKCYSELHSPMSVLSGTFSCLLAQYELCFMVKIH